MHTPDDKTNKAEGLYELGKFYFINKKFDQAIIEFKKVLKLDPDNIDVYYQLGLCCEALNNIEDARSYYKKVLEHKPKHALAAEHLEKLIER
jgi:tetratricopeptide (TPR) repeat protein